MAMAMAGEGITPRSSHHHTGSPTEMNYVGPVNGAALYQPGAMSEVTSPTGPMMSPPLSMNGSNGDARHARVALSAVVPDFAPASQLPAVNGSVMPSDASQPGHDIFSDAEVENLVIVVRKQGPNNRKAPFQNAGTRTYSNGSIDETMIADAIGSAKGQLSEAANGQVDRFVGPSILSL
jgi:hypothetical protein